MNNVSIHRYTFLSMEYNYENNRISWGITSKKKKLLKILVSAVIIKFKFLQVLSFLYIKYKKIQDC